VASGEGGLEFVDAPSGEDNYVDGATFSGTTRDLTLTRTGTLEDITVNIPCCNPVDVIGGTTYPDIKYGALYNWWAATDARNIAPAGWHVPTANDFATLMRFLDPDGIGVNNDAGGQLKEIGTTHWDSPNTGASNTSSFNGRGSGWRSSTFLLNKSYCILWNSTKVDLVYQTSQLTALEAVFYTSYLNSIQGTGDRFIGFSIRLLKDNTTDTGTMTGNDGKVYPTVTIGTQVWMAANLAETKYRNGDPISFHGETYTDKYTNAEWAALTTEAMCWYEDNPDNGYTDVAVIQHNLLGGLQGGNATERYHHTADEIAYHVYATGASGSFTTADSKTVTVVNGIITDIT